MFNETLIAESDEPGGQYLLFAFDERRRERFLLARWLSIDRIGVACLIRATPAAIGDGESHTGQRRRRQRRRLNH